MSHLIDKIKVNLSPRRLVLGRFPNWVLFCLIVFGVVLNCGTAICAEVEDSEDLWPFAAQKRGLFLPKPREVAVKIDAKGAYIPQIGSLSSGNTFWGEGSAVWNFALVKKIGLFGAHSAGVMGWDNIKWSVYSNDVGARVLFKEFFSLELAYVTHKIQTVTLTQKDDDGVVRDYVSHPGGWMDRGGELLSNFRVSPIENIRVDMGLGGKYFSVLTEDHLVLSSYLLLGIMLFDGHKLEFGANLFEIWRFNRRKNVDFFTHNTMLKLAWMSNLNNFVGLSFEVLFSFNLLAGEAPMFELPRSAIGEPMGNLSMGIFFRF